MTFKRLDESHINLILCLQKDNFPDGWNFEQLSSGFSSGGLNAICLEEGQKPVGLITYSLSLDTADIEGVVVISSERKKDYGKRLVDFALSELKTNGVKKALLEVRESNLPAIALYSACGFNKISIRKKYYSDGENAIVMIKEL